MIMMPQYIPLTSGFHGERLTSGCHGERLAVRDGCYRDSAVVTFPGDCRVGMTDEQGNSHAAPPPGCHGRREIEIHHCYGDRVVATIGCHGDRGKECEYRLSRAMYGHCPLLQCVDRP